MVMGNYINNETVIHDGVTFLKDHKEFDYSDGDSAESYILSVINSCRDCSSDSSELEQYIRDWPSLYHLSRERTLAYRALNIPLDGAILEVGSGCGSITRYLGEQGADVIALEGSPRRASITHARTADLENVNVLCASFEDVSFKRKFDVVICNGVLEYASLFVKANKPAEHMISLLSSLLEENGSLIIAIENKFGLRYFSSSKEDHTGIMFDGIEGYPSIQQGPQTYGLSELKGMLHEEFRNVDVLFPLPDYKLPTAIIREKLVELADCSEIYSNTMRHDFGTYVLPRMHERLVWPELNKNKLLGQMSNSFFVVAGNRKTKLFNDTWLGEIFSIKRKKEWAVRTSISVDEAGLVKTDKSYIENDAIRNTKDTFHHHNASTRWVNGSSLHSDVVRSLTRKGSINLEDRIKSHVKLWWNEIEKKQLEDQKLEGATMDHNWQNAILSEDGLVFIDCEWEWQEPIPSAWLLYRTVTKFVREEVYFVHRWERRCRFITPLNLFKTISRITGNVSSLAVILNVFSMERKFQKIVIGKSPNMFVMLASLVVPLIVRQKILRSMAFFKKVRNRLKRLVA